MKLRKWNFWSKWLFYFQSSHTFTAAFPRGSHPSLSSRTPVDTNHIGPPFTAVSKRVCYTFYLKIKNQINRNMVAILDLTLETLKRKNNSFNEFFGIFIVKMRYCIKISDFYLKSWKIIRFRIGHWRPSWSLLLTRFQQLVHEVVFLGCVSRHMQIWISFANLLQHPMSTCLQNGIWPPGY